MRGRRNRVRAVSGGVFGSDEVSGSATRGVFDRSQTAPAHRVQTRTINLLERLFGEGKRRSKVIPRFPSETSGLTLLFAVLVDAPEGWRGVRMTTAIQERLESARADAPIRTALSPTKDNLIHLTFEVIVVYINVLREGK